jgi:hypothetical protein
LYDATRDVREEEVRKILMENKEVNVNWKDSIGWTALHRACSFGNDKIVSMLLAHPDIDVNQKANDGSTPFMWACVNGRTGCVRLLLKDPRVKVNELGNEGTTPLYYAAWDGYLEMIKWWIASGRHLDLGEPGNEKNDAIGGAKKRMKTEVVSLLERFRDHQEKTRHDIRKELGCFDELAAEIFALVVFLSDGLLQIKEENPTGAAAARFFKTMKKLPMELQTILCRRVVGSTGENIPGERSEAVHL